MDHYLIPQYQIQINIKLVKIKKISNEEVGSQLHQFICHGCTSIKEGPRYISLTARLGKYQSRGYVDFCHECFMILKQKSEKAKEIVYYSAKDGMVLDSLFTRVLFWYGNYQTF